MSAGLILTDPELKTLTWLAKNFPFSLSRWDKTSDWATVWSALAKECGVQDEADAETTVKRLVTLGFFEGGRHTAGMFSGRLMTPGEQYLRRIEREEAAIRAQGPRWKQYARKVTFDVATLTYRLVLGLVVGALLGFVISSVLQVGSVLAAAVAGGLGGAIGGGIGTKK